VGLLVESILLSSPSEGDNPQGRSSLQQVLRDETLQGGSRNMGYMLHYWLAWGLAINEWKDTVEQSLVYV
jgi:hypothetical protein